MRISCQLSKPWLGQPGLNDVIRIALGSHIDDLRRASLATQKVQDGYEASLRLKTRAGDVIAQRVWQESETDAVQRVLRKARRHLDQSVGAYHPMRALPSLLRRR